MTAAFVIFLCLISLLAAALVWGALRGRREADAYVDAMFAPVFAKGALSAEAAFREFDAAIRAGDLIVSRESTDEDLPLPETSAAFFRVFARIEIPRTRLTLDRAHLRTKVPGLVVIGTNGARDVVVRRTTGEVSVSGTTQWYPTLFHFVLAQLELHRSAPEAPAGTGDLVAAARRRALLVSAASPP